MNHKCPGRAPGRLPSHGGRDLGTHTHTLETPQQPRRKRKRELRERSVPLFREMRICGRLSRSSACLMSVCGTDGEEARADSGTPESRCVFCASCYQRTDSFIFTGPGTRRLHRRSHGKQRVLAGNLTLMRITLFNFSHCLE